MRLYTHYGSNGAIVGPANLAQAHSNDEHIVIDDLVGYARLIARFPDENVQPELRRLNNDPGMWRAM